MTRGPTSGNLHSRMVVVLKLTLPLLALAILSSLFLFSRPFDPEDAIPYADVEIADRLAQPRMTGAGFSAMMSDGASLTLSAKEATPMPGGALISGLTGVLTPPGAAETRITAATGQLDRATARLSLRDGVRLETSQGYTIDSAELQIGTDRTWAESPGAVTAAAPMGDLTAGGLRLDLSSDSKTYLLVFNKGVRLLYQPQH